MRKTHSASDLSIKVFNIFRYVWFANGSHTPRTYLQRSRRLQGTSVMDHRHIQIGLKNKSNWHIFNHSICKVWVVTSYITSADGPDDVHKTFSLLTISDNHRLACKVELSLSSQSGQQSMPGTEYDSAINVHIHVCCSSVPGHASSYVPGMSVAYENQGLVR